MGQETAEREALNGCWLPEWNGASGSRARSTPTPEDAVGKTKVSSSRPLCHVSVTTSAISPCRLRGGTGSGFVVG